MDVNHQQILPHLNQEEADYASMLDAGYRFHPKDAELILHYLKPKIDHRDVPGCRVYDVDLYDYKPQQLAERYRANENVWYFFTSRERKYLNGSRPKRSAGDYGHWRTTQRAVTVYDDATEQMVGFKRSLAFHDENNRKTPWLMHEYTTNDPDLPIGSGQNGYRLNDWVLCSIYKKGPNQSDNNNEGQNRRNRRAQEDQNRRTRRVQHFQNRRNQQVQNRRNPAVVIQEQLLHDDPNQTNNDNQVDVVQNQEQVQDHPNQTNYDNQLEVVHNQGVVLMGEQNQGHDEPPQRRRRVSGNANHDTNVVEMVEPLSFMWGSSDQQSLYNVLLHNNTTATTGSAAQTSLPTTLHASTSIQPSLQHPLQHYQHQFTSTDSLIMEPPAIAAAQLGGLGSYPVTSIGQFTSTGVGFSNGPSISTSMEPALVAATEPGGRGDYGLPTSQDVFLHNNTTTTGSAAQTSLPTLHASTSIQPSLQHRLQHYQHQFTSTGALIMEPPAIAAAQLGGYTTTLGSYPVTSIGQFTSTGTNGVGFSNSALNSTSMELADHVAATELGDCLMVTSREVNEQDVQNWYQDPESLPNVQNVPNESMVVTFGDVYQDVQSLPNLQNVSNESMMVTSRAVNDQQNLYQEDPQNNNLGGNVRNCWNESFMGTNWNIGGGMSMSMSPPHDDMSFFNCATTDALADWWSTQHIL